jgi:hypothetical protein
MKYAREHPAHERIYRQHQADVEANRVNPRLEVRPQHVPQPGFVISVLPRKPLIYVTGAGIIASGISTYVYARQHNWPRMLISGLLCGCCLYWTYILLMYYDDNSQPDD